MEVERKNDKIGRKSSDNKKILWRKKIIEISREVGLNRGTVSNYIKEYESIQKEIDIG